MRLSSLAKSAAGVALGVAIAGCIALPDVSQEPNLTPGSTATSTAKPGSGACAPRPEPTESLGSLEGAFRYSQMGQFADEVMNNFITPFLQCTWPGIPAPDVFYVARGVSGFEDCLDAGGDVGRYTSESFEYCPADQTVYLGQDMLWLLYDRTGDAGAAVGMAHEVGHHFQQRVGIPPPQTAQQSIRHENQADCIAGAWVQFTERILHNLEPQDDLQDIDTLMPLIGSAEGPDRDHGTAAERVQAFQLGYGQGIAACSQFYPGAPLTRSG